MGRRGLLLPRGGRGLSAGSSSRTSSLSSSSLYSAPASIDSERRERRDRRLPPAATHLRAHSRHPRPRSTAPAPTPTPTWCGPGPAASLRLPPAAAQSAAALRGRPLADRKNSRACEGAPLTGSSEESPPAGQSVPPAAPGAPRIPCGPQPFPWQRGAGAGPGCPRALVIGVKPRLSPYNATHWLRRAERDGRKRRWRMRGWRAAKRAAVAEGFCNRSSAFASYPA